MAATRNSSISNIPSTKKNKAITGIGDSSNKVNKVDIIDVNNIKISKSAKYKEFIYLKESKVGFLTPGARLAFTQLR